MSNVAIKVENLGKLYRLGEVGTGTISHDINRWWARLRGKEDPFAQVGETNDRTTKGDSDYVWALKDVSFDVKQGEVLGIIGRNGAGKSTLLKLLSKVTQPTTGSIKVKGRIASLLEVGTGFHPEMTGRENIFQNGAILGMTRTEIRAKFDEIVDFSGVERYIDTPVKRYSSGMYVRLAFAVAAHLEPEILIIDEVLAVGDAEFQKKCLGKMKDVSVNDGRTVLFVSHNIGAIRGLCTKGLLMANGQLAQAGDINEVIAKYLVNPTAEFKIVNSKDDQVRFTRVALSNGKEYTQNFRFGEDLTVEIDYETDNRYELPHFWLSVESQYGSVFAANMLIDNQRPQLVQGKGRISCTFRKLPLLPQTYSIWLGLRDKDGRAMLSSSKEVAFFNVTGGFENYQYTGVHSETVATDASPVIVEYDWTMPDGAVVPVRLIK